MAKNKKILSDLLIKQNNKSDKNKNIQDVTNSLFMKDDIFNNYIRTRLDKKRIENNISKKTNNFLKIIAVQSLSLSLIAKDMKTLKQNFVKFVNKENNVLNKTKVKKQRIDDLEFLKKQDEKEAELEAERSKSPTKIELKKEERVIKKEESSKGFFEIIKDNFLNSFQELFKSKSITGILTRVFVIAKLFEGLFKGIKDAYNEWKETGDLKKAVKTGLTSFIDTITFGFFGAESIRNAIDTIDEFLTPIVSIITNTFKKIKDWVVNNVGIPEIKFKIPVINKEVSIGPWYPFKDNPESKYKETENISPTKKSKPSLTDEQRSIAQNSVKEYIKIQNELSNLDTDKKKEKSKIKKQLPEGFSNDPRSPNYPIELKQIDEKYNRLRKDKTKRLQELRSIKGVREELKKHQNENNSNNVTKVSIDETDLSPEAKKAKEQLKSLDEKHDSERNAVVDRLKKEGKISGEFATSIDFQNIDELKNLKIKQDEERGKLVNKINQITSVSTSPTSVSTADSTNIGIEKTPMQTTFNTVPAVSPSETTSTIFSDITTSPQSTPSVDQITPSPMNHRPPISGHELSSSSIDIAESQRKEFNDVSQNTVINAPVNNTSKSRVGETKQSAASVYDTDFLRYLATT